MKPVEAPDSDSDGTGTSGSSDEWQGYGSAIAMREARARRRNRIHLTLVFLTIVAGVLEIVVVEQCGFLEAAWVITQVVTTIGYGDITFQSDNSRWFMSFYILWLLVLVAYFMNQYLEKMWSKQADRLKHRLHALEASAADSRIMKKIHRSKSDLLGTDKPLCDNNAWRELAPPATLFFGHLLFGTFFFMWLEPCSCSYSNTKIEECTPETACEDGMRKDLATSFYMAMVTLTTVGFGDVTPATELGRAVAIPWMLSGILSTGMFVEALQTMFFSTRGNSDDLNDEDLCREIFDKCGGKSKGSLKKVEFLSFVLVNHALVDQDLFVVRAWASAQLCICCISALKLRRHRDNRYLQMRKQEATSHS